MPGEKIRSKKIRVQVNPLVSPVEYYVAIGSGLACIAVLVILVLVIFAFRRFEVQHDITCLSDIKFDEIDAIKSVENRYSLPVKGIEFIRKFASHLCV